MSGKPQYDESEVIAAAINVFWRHGYAAAAVSDLTEATGLSRSSLYQRFQDKDGLFQEALAVYSARLLARMRSFEGQTARERLRTLLLAFLPQGASRPAGCLVARSCAELPDLSADSRAAALAGLKDQRAIFVDLLRKGVAAGELAKNADIDAMSWHYLGVLQAVLNFPQSGADPAVLNSMVDVAMASWPTSHKAR